MKVETDQHTVSAYNINTSCVENMVNHVCDTDSNPPVLAGNLLFLANISGPSFRLPSQRKMMFSLFSQSFKHIFCGFSAFFYQFSILA